MSDRHAFKADAGKPRYSLLPWEALAVVVEVMEVGARKYAPHSWRTVEDCAARYADAAQRHLAAVMRGETRDEETGLPHKAHAIASLLISLAADLASRED